MGFFKIRSGCSDFDRDKWDNLVIENGVVIVIKGFFVNGSVFFN